jgi:hypothetical protein
MPVQFCLPPSACSTTAGPLPTGSTPPNSPGVTPQITVDLDTIYVNDRAITTSTDVTTGIDLTLALVEGQRSGESAARGGHGQPLGSTLTCRLRYATLTSVRGL